MDTLTTQIYIDYLFKDKNVSLIEVWENKLFIWKYKGRPTFQTALGLEFKLPVYYRIDDYKKVSKKYHPDISKSKSVRVSSGEIQAIINDTKPLLDVQSRGYNAGDYLQFYGEFDRILSSRANASRSNSVRELSARLYNSSRMVQDRFSKQSEGFEALLQSMADSTVSGQDIKDGLRDIFGESKERSRQREIEYWNEPSLRRKAKKNNYTVYGTLSLSRRKGLRKQYGDVFRVCVGGPCDSSSL